MRDGFDGLLLGDTADAGAPASVVSIVKESTTPLLMQIHYTRTAGRDCCRLTCSHASRRRAMSLCIAGARGTASRSLTTRSVNAE